MYYEENNIIPKEEYKHIIDTLHKEKKFRPARISVVRKVFFNREINYLTDAVSVNQENTDSYCVMMTDWDTDHLILRRAIHGCRKKSLNGSWMVIMNGWPPPESRFSEIFICS